jgi:glycine/D-amino acid oxidase-like deaminating enzyme
MTAVDVAIVGRVTGSSMAYHLARAGAQVRVFEHCEPLAGVGAAPD